MSVALVPTGTANVASVVAAFRRLGEDVAIVRAAPEIESAPMLVLPGVGTFGAAAAELTRSGIGGALRRRVAAGRPTLAICVGMQLLASTSDESDRAEGIGAFAQHVRRFPDGMTVPQMGWNWVEPESGCRLVSGGWAYFANSYRLEKVPQGWRGAVSEHGGSFVAALEREGVLACQFHPELSGAWGSDLLGRWLGLGKVD